MDWTWFVVITGVIVAVLTFLAYAILAGTDGDDADLHPT